MKALMKNMCFALAMGALALLPGLQLFAQRASEPAVVVSFASLNEQLEDIVYFAEAAGMKPMAMMTKVTIEGYAKGVDKSKPAGALLYFNDDSPEPKALVFVPIENLDDVLNNIANYVEMDEDVDPMRLSVAGNEFFLKLVDGFAFVSEDKEMFDNLPSQPDKILGDLPSRFNLSARVYAQRIPQEHRDQIIAMIEQSYQDSLEQMGDDLTSELQQKNFEMQMAQIRSMINETEELVLGLAVDQKDKNVHFDAVMVGQEGSVLSKASESYQNAEPSQFQGFLLDGAAFTVNMCSQMMEEDSAQYQQIVGDFRKEIADKLDADENLGEDEKQFIEKLTSDLFDILGKTIEEGVLDAGAAVVVDDSSANFAMGMRCAETAKLETVIRDFAKMAQEKADHKVEVQLDDTKKFGVNFHKVVIPIPEDEAEARQLIGETATIYAGIGDNVFYLAGGSNPMELLERAITSDKNSKQSNSMDMNLYLAPILRKAAQMQNEEVVQQMADKLAENGRDRVRVTGGSVDNGVTFRLEIQDGILQLISVAAQQMGGMMGGGPGADF